MLSLKVVYWRRYDHSLHCFPNSDDFLRSTTMSQLAASSPPKPGALANSGTLSRFSSEVGGSRFGKPAFMTGLTTVYYAVVMKQLRTCWWWRSIALFGWLRGRRSKIARVHPSLPCAPGQYNILDSLRIETILFQRKVCAFRTVAIFGAPSGIRAARA